MIQTRSSNSFSILIRHCRIYIHKNWHLNHRPYKYWCVVTQLLSFETEIMFQVTRQMNINKFFIKFHNHIEFFFRLDDVDYSSYICNDLESESKSNICYVFVPNTSHTVTMWTNHAVWRFNHFLQLQVNVRVSWHSVVCFDVSNMCRCLLYACNK